VQARERGNSNGSWPGRESRYMGQKRWDEEATRLLPQGQLVVIPWIPHDVNYNSPVELTRVIRAFMIEERS
jgi:hypothetical protein